MEKIVFVGAGSMAEAVIAGVVESGVIQPKNICIMNKSDDERLLALKSKYGVSILCNGKEALRNADLIVLATKPKDIHHAMADISPYMSNNAAVLSVIAGIPICTIEKGLGARAIARCMPNTSATIGKSASGVAWNETMGQEMKALILSLLGAIGIVKEVEEDKLHAVTALSGSGPAYIYYLVEALEDAALDKGLTLDVARELIVQTLEGAAAMLKQTGTEPNVLRKNVTSPGGTTEAGLRALENGHFKELIFSCIDRAELRSRELGNES